jgi:NTP pyrophosphatase (non-canonical NTP hydrolase)
MSTDLGNPVNVLQKYDVFVDENWFVGNSDLGGLPEAAYLGLCIAGEASEISEKLKKAYRDNGGKVNVVLMAKEIGDVLYYLMRYAHLLGYDLEGIARLNVEKLESRKERGKLRGEGDDR